MPPNLDQLARNYLLKPKFDRSQEKAAVVNAGDAIVFPLLGVGCQLLEEVRVKDFKDLLKKAKQSTLGGDSAYLFFIKLYGQGPIDGIIDVTSDIGQRGWDVICRALREQNTGIRLLAALSLFEHDNPTDRTANQIQDAHQAIYSREPKFLVNSGLSLLLIPLLAQAGEMKGKYKITLNQWLINKRVTLDEYRERSRFTTWQYLLDIGFKK